MSGQATTRDWADWDPAKDPMPRELVVTGDRRHQIETFRRVLLEEGSRARTANDDARHGGCHCDAAPHDNIVHDSAMIDAPLLAAALADVLALAAERENTTPEVAAFVAELRNRLEYRLHPLAEFVLDGALGFPGPEVGAAIALLVGGES